MKKVINIFLIIVCGCRAEPPVDVEQRKAILTTQMEVRVNTIIKQLHEDCDSSILQAARFKADSLKSVVERRPATKKPAKYGRSKSK